MSDSRTDEIAREAARLIETSRAQTIGDAVRAAVDALGYFDAPRPGKVLVRRHARAMAMQALGEDGYAAQINHLWQAAEDLMTVLEQDLGEETTLLVGRAAKGQIDAGVVVHVRVYTNRSIGDLARLVVGYGYDEPAFETADTLHGRMNRLRLVEDGNTFVVTRCPPSVPAERELDLFTGRSLPTATLPQLRRLMVRTGEQ